VRVFGASKGRPPDVYVFNPDVEAEVLGLPPSPTAAKVAADLGVLPMFLAGKDDAVVVTRAPSPAFCAALVEAGFEVPEWIPARPSGDRRIRAVIPWGLGPATAAAWGTPWDPAWSRIYAKTTGAAWLREWLAGGDRGATDAVLDPAFLCAPDDVGVACRSEAEVLAARERLGDRDVVLKAPWSTAGRGLRRWGPGVEGWITETLATQGAIVVEPWLDRVLDLSMQFRVDDRVTVLDWGRFRTDARGRYLGAVLGRRTDGLSPELVRFLHGGGAIANRVVRMLHAVAMHAGARMGALGFRGAAGIDAFVYRSPDGLRLKPLVEVNPRLTMGRIALALERRVLRGRVGLWVQPTVRAIRRAGFRDVPAFADDLRARAPLRITKNLIEDGALFTSDPAQAALVTSVLVVGESLGACEAKLGPLAE
jgi:hypothetical protein